MSSSKAASSVSSSSSPRLPAKDGKSSDRAGPRPPLRSRVSDERGSGETNHPNHNHEENPFELSFSKSGSSNSIPAHNNNSGITDKPKKLPTPGAKLPPVSFIDSPSPSDMSRFGWEFSLRSGPLSPAMLSGPAPQPGSSSPNQYGSYKFPALTPRTAGVFKACTTLTDTPQDPVPPTEKNQFDASFSIAVSSPSASVSTGEREASVPVGPINLASPRSLASLAAAAAASQQPPTELHGSQCSHAPGEHGGNLESRSVIPGSYDSLPSRRKSKNSTSTLPHSEPGVTSTARNSSSPDESNPLYLLSQATDDKAAAAAAAALSNLNNAAQSYSPASRQGHPNLTNPSPTQAGKRKASPNDADVGLFQEQKVKRMSSSQSHPTPHSQPQSTAKRKNDDPTPPKRGKKSRTDSVESINPVGGDGDEAAKRASFLERNRIAASKCRARKKEWQANLEQRVQFLTADNEALQNTVHSLREEVASLRAILLNHRDCPVSLSIP